jgi:hypothetical protein
MDVSRGKTETYFIRDLLHPEIETEIRKTRRLFEALPDDRSDFKPYEKSMTLGRLAGHTTDLFRLITLTLTGSEFDMAVAWQPYTMAGHAELLARFEENASAALAAFRETSDEAFHQPWTIKRGPNVLFSGIALPIFAIKGSTRLFITVPNSARTFALLDCHCLACMALLQTESSSSLVYDETWFKKIG